MRTVLVCVRTPLVAQSIMSCAARLGVATVRTAVSEAEVLARLAEQPAELILADTAVTRPDTVRFTRRVLASAPEALLVLFGAEEPMAAAAAVTAGARGLIRGGDHDLVGTVTKALLLIGSTRRSPDREAVGSAPAAGPTGRLGARRLGTATGAAHSGAVRPAVGERTNGPLGTSGPGLSVPAQRGDLVPGGRPPLDGAGGRRGAARRAALTERELQVLRGMAEGRSNAEIGRELYVSEDTVKTHARRLFRKLAVRDRAHAVAVGFRAGALE